MSECRALVRVRVPDRPGALGLVASRIGAVKGDIVGIEVLDRSAGDALDELAVILPDDALVPTLEREIAEVDGASVVAIALVDAFPEPRLDELHYALALAQARDASALVGALHRRIDALLQPAWIHVAGAGLAIGSDGLAPGGSVPAGASDVLELAGSGFTVSYRRTAPLTPGERSLVAAYCDLVDALWLRLPAASAASAPATEA